MNDKNKELFREIQQMKKQLQKMLETVDAFREAGVL